MAVFMLDDIAGSVEVVVFPETFGKHGQLIAADAMLLVRGKFEKDDESARLVATELQPISMLKERTTREVVIHLHGAAARRRSRRSRSCCRATAAIAACLLELDVKKNGGTAAARPRGRRPARAAVGEAGGGSRTVVRTGSVIR